jgi:hypothetical protein
MPVDIQQGINKEIFDARMCIAVYLGFFFKIIIANTVQYPFLKRSK